jgi:PAS domain S-box-containing protein
MELRQGQRVASPEDIDFERLKFALQLARTGIWERDLRTNRTVRTPVVDEMFGFAPGEAGPDAAPFLARIHPDDRAEMERSIDRALVSGGAAETTFRVRHGDGTERRIAGRAEIVVDGTGKPARLLSVLRDVTEQHAAELALRESESEFRAIFEMAGRGKALGDASGRLLMVNRAFCDITGYPADALRTMTIRDLTHPDDWPDETVLIERLLAGAVASIDREKRYVRKDGRIIWVRVSTVMLAGRDRKPRRMVAVIEDITAQKRAALALAEETRRLDILNRTGATLASELDLERLVQVITDAGVALTGAAFGAFFYNLKDDRGESYTLYALSGVPREAFAKFPMPRNTAVFAPTFGGEGVVRSDDITADPRYGKNAPHRGMPEGHLPVRSYLAVPVVSRSGEALGGLFFGHPEPGMFTAATERLMTGVAAQAAIAIDNARLYHAAQREIAERRSAEERLTTLAGEVDHRAKNMLAIMQAIVRLTKAASADEYVALLTGRINALAQTHALLAASRWTGADLARLVADELAPYHAEGRSQVAASGPPVQLGPASAQSAAIAIHELMTNAVKYGALSTPFGRVRLDWQLDGSDRVRISWNESGGPPVQAPQRQGFGTTAIERMIRHQLGGDVRLDWRPQGLSCELVFPRQ